MRFSSVTLGALAVMTVPVTAQQRFVPEPSIELPAELERVLREYESAWRRGGAELAALFTEDGFVLARSQALSYSLSTRSSSAGSSMLGSGTNRCCAVTGTVITASALNWYEEVRERAGN